MSIQLLSKAPLTENQANFADSTPSPNQNILGLIFWNDPVEENGKLKITFWGGMDVVGNYIEKTTIEVEATSEPINPTKVFWWIAEKAKRLLCPSCT